MSKITLSNVNGTAIFHHDCENNTIKKTILEFAASKYLPPTRGILLEGMKLDNMSLKSGNFNKAIFKNVKFNDTIFDGPMLANATFYKCNVKGSIFTKNTSLHYTQFVNCKIDNAEFYGKHLENAEFSNCTGFNNVVSCRKIDGIMVNTTSRLSSVGEHIYDKPTWFNMIRRLNSGYIDYALPNKLRKWLEDSQEEFIDELNLNWKCNIKLTA